MGAEWPSAHDSMINPPIEGSSSAPTQVPAGHPVLPRGRQINSYFWSARRGHGRIDPRRSPPPLASRCRSVPKDRGEQIIGVEPAPVLVDESDDADSRHRRRLTAPAGNEGEAMSSHARRPPRRTRRVRRHRAYKAIEVCRHSSAARMWCRVLTRRARSRGRGHVLSAGRQKVQTSLDQASPIHTQARAGRRSRDRVRPPRVCSPICAPGARPTSCRPPT
jgi:hypothetical protein